MFIAGWPPDRKGVVWMQMFGIGARTKPELPSKTELL
jgi:hypothetical protein